MANCLWKELGYESRARRYTASRFGNTRYHGMRESLARSQLNSPTNAEHGAESRAPGSQTALKPMGLLRNGGFAIPVKGSHEYPKAQFASILKGEFIGERLRCTSFSILDLLFPMKLLTIRHVLLPSRTVREIREGAEALRWGSEMRSRQNQRKRTSSSISTFITS